MSIAPEMNTRHRPQFGLTHRLVRAREVAGLEQIDIAEALDVSRATISNYERGVTRPSKLQLNAWAVTCDVDADWLKEGDSASDPRNGPGRGPRSGNETIQYHNSPVNMRPVAELNPLRYAS